MYVGVCGVLFLFFFFLVSFPHEQLIHNVFPGGVLF